MKNYTFYWEMESLIIQFMNALDDCVIKRYDGAREERDQISVRIIYAPKSRTLHNLVNRQQNLELPVISVSLGGMNRNPSRVFNKIDGPVIMQDRMQEPMQPIPVDITLNVSFLAKYQRDMDQMISNMIPYFDPYIIISWTHPEMSQELRSKAEWSGSLSYNYPTDITSNTSYRLGVDTSFTLHGWLFKKGKDTTPIIYTIDSRAAGVSETPSYYDDIENYNHDINTYGGAPIIREPSPTFIKKDSPSSIKLHCNWLTKTESVYLSGTMLSGDYVDLYSSSENLSANNPPFNAVLLDSFTIEDNTINITLEPLQESGIIDIIVANEAGYGSVIKNATEILPWKDGIFVI